MNTAINISAEEAELIQSLSDETALISIGNPHEPFWDLKVSGEDVLTLVFSDLTAPMVSGGRKYEPISMSQARTLVEFAAARCGKKFIVNCQAGISRSAAICLFLNKNYGHALKPSFWSLSHPNPLVYGMLQTAHELFVMKAR